MHSKSILQFALEFTLGLGVAFIALTAVAAAWTGPTAPPPQANVAAPINVSPVWQDKPGNLELLGLSISTSPMGSITSPEYCIGSSCITSWASLNNTDTLDTVTGRGSVTANPVTVGGLVVGTNQNSQSAGNFAGIGFNSYFNSRADSWYDNGGGYAGFIYINPKSGTMNFWLSNAAAGSSLKSAQAKPLQLDTNGGLSVNGSLYVRGAQLHVYGDLCMTDANGTSCYTRAQLDAAVASLK